MEFALIGKHVIRIEAGLDAPIRSHKWALYWVRA